MGRKRRSISPPPLRRRRSFSRSPVRRRSRSPLPPRRSPPIKRSPTPPSPSEWETDTETEEESEDVKKEVVKEEKEAVEQKPVPSKKPVKVEDPDASVDDVLKLDATDEVDEFSAFLNEFEDEVLAEKEASKENLDKKVKKDRPETEKKVVDGKRLRKKIKEKKAAVRQNSRNRSVSPKWGMGSTAGGGRSPLGGGRSPGRRYFSPGRSRDGKFSPRRRNRTPSLSPESRRRKVHKSPLQTEGRSIK